MCWRTRPSAPLDSRSQHRCSIHGCHLSTRLAVQTVTPPSGHDCQRPAAQELGLVDPKPPALHLHSSLACRADPWQICRRNVNGTSFVPHIRNQHIPQASVASSGASLAAMRPCMSAECSMPHTPILLNKRCGSRRAMSATDQPSQMTHFVETGLDRSCCHAVLRILLGYGCHHIAGSACQHCARKRLAKHLPERAERHRLRPGRQLSGR